MSIPHSGVILLDGKAVAKKRLALLKQRIENLPSPKPKLCILRVGEDIASGIYIQRKIALAHQAGIETQVIHQRHITQESLEALLRDVSLDHGIHAMILQLPLTQNLSMLEALWHLSPDKDADGLHPLNMGKLLMGNPHILPCTPQGILHLLDYYDIGIKGKNVLVVGRSLIVGTPLSVILTQRGATVTLCHSHTRHLEMQASNTHADIVVCATGAENVLDTNAFRPNTVLIDVGMVRGEDGIRGDVVSKAFLTQGVPSNLKAYTPVPGGVGPMTVIALLENTFKLYLAQHPHLHLEHGTI